MRRNAPSVSLVGIALCSPCCPPPTASRSAGERDTTSDAKKQPDAVMTVQTRTAPLLEKPRMIGGRTLLTLHEGDLVTVVDAKQAASVAAAKQPDTPGARDRKARPPFTWYRVSPRGDPMIGYMHHSMLLRGQVALRPMDDVRLRASASEVALGGRGFDEIVERQYRQSHPNLASAFVTVDDIERDPLFNPGIDEVSRFVDATTMVGVAP